ncbi:MAG TPA: restriction endonuclease subunit S [Tissierellaceae bacterium]|nr:restriction endonuclease subunit S [Tissierellaceae bacterium]
MTEKLIPELRFPEFSGEWEEKRLGKMFNFIKRYSYSRNDEGEGIYHHIHYGDIHSIFDGIITEKTNIPSIKSNSEHIELKNEDIVIADASENYEDLGKGVMILDKGQRKLIAGSHTFALRHRKNIKPLYFLYYSQSNEYKRYMYRIGTGISVFGISKSNLEKVDILLPTLQEQEKIGSFFASIDKKLQLQEKKIDKLKEYKKAMMQRIFSQEIRFKDGNGNDYPKWEESRIDKLFDLKAGGDIDRNNVSDKQTEKKTFPVYANSLINDGLYGYTDKYKISGETITVTARGTLGYAIARNEKYYPIVRLLILTPKHKENIEFFAYNINLLKIFNEASGVPQLTAPQLSSYKIKCPIKEEQTKIANFLSSIDKKISLEEEKLEMQKDYKKGLMQRMFI